MKNTELSPNELSPAFIGPSAFNPLVMNDNASRGQMVTTHLGQRLVTKGNTPRRWQTGVEHDWGKYTFKVEMPEDGQILAVIRRYPPSHDINAIVHNPQTVVIYQNIHTKEIDYVDLTDFSRQHQYFGFGYKQNEALKKIHEGAFIPKGTVFLNSPCVTDEGEYAYGVRTKVAFMTHPAVSEDGILINREFLEKLKFKIFETRTISWGSDKFALNTYGDEHVYRTFPEIGSPIREDGVVMALRTAQDHPELFVVERSRKATRAFSPTFDEAVYAPPGGKVIDVVIHHRRYDSNIAETHTDTQAQRYYEAGRSFHQKIIDEHLRHHGRNFKQSPRYQELVRTAAAVCSDSDKRDRSLDKQPPKVALCYRNEPMDVYRATITIEYEIEPTIGFKLTDLHGGKGVFVRVVEPEKMPRDKNGQVADICVDPNSTINRANVGRFFEQYLGAAAVEAENRLASMLELKIGTYQEVAKSHIENLPVSKVDEAMAYLMEFYRIASPELYDKLVQSNALADRDDRIDYLAELMEISLGGWMPVSQQKPAYQVVKDLEESKYRPLHDTVTFMDDEGNLVESTEKVRIAEIYTILLEKIGDDWAAVSSARFQIMGVLAQLTKQSRVMKPVRNQPPRMPGEAEERLIASTCPEATLPEMLDRANSRSTHTAVCRGLLKDDTPSNVQNLVDRNVQYFGTHTALVSIKHQINCAGAVIKHQPYQPA